MKTPTSKSQIPTEENGTMSTSQTGNKEDIAAIRPAKGSSLGKYDLSERTFLFAARVLRFVGSLPVSVEAQTIRRQLIRAGTSIGANVEEADGSDSRREKRRAFVIARKEAREVRYWLRLAGHFWSDQVQVSPEVQEVGELIRILSVIIEKLEPRG